MKTILMLCALSFGTTNAAAADAADAPVITNVNGFNDSLIAGWPEKPRAIARAMFEKYGAPDTYSDRMLVWHDNGAWKRTIVYRDEVEHMFPVKHTDFLEQTVAYKVPLDKVGDLARFDGSVIVDRTRGELSARCDKEENNRLALNMADEISRGKRSVSDARAFLTKTIAMRMAGKSSESMDKLSFTPASPVDAADQDAGTIETK
jgi:hypothetical protein